MAMRARVKVASIKIPERDGQRVELTEVYSGPSCYLLTGLRIPDPALWNPGKEEYRWPRLAG